MAEQEQTDTTEQPDEGTEQAEQPDTGGEEPDPAAEAEKWKALARKHEQQAKKNAEAAKRLTEIEESQKTEQQKLADAKEAADKAAADATAEAIRMRVAMRYGLEEEDLDLLGTGDEEQIEARAKRLHERSKPTESEETPAPSRRPRERLRPGATPAAEPEENDPIKLAEGLPRHY